MCYNGFVNIANKLGTHQADATDFFLAPGVTVMKVDEILTSVGIPAPAANTGAAFIKIGRVKSDIAKISICVVIERDGDTVKNCRMSMGSVAARPLFLKDIATALVGKKMTEALVMETAQQISDFIKPITDNRTTAEYRKDLAKVIAEDCLKSAWERSGGELK